MNSTNLVGPDINPQCIDWTSPDELLINNFERVFRDAITCIHTRANDPVASCLLAFALRCANSWKSIVVLRRQRCDTTLLDIAAILRCMIEASFQAEYVIKDPSAATDLAKEFFEFEAVELWRRRRQLIGHGTNLGNRLANSPRRTASEPECKAAFLAVKKKFLKKTAPATISHDDDRNCRMHWYEPNVGNLAKKINREAEYDGLYTALSGAVHSSSTAVYGKLPVVTRDVVSFDAAVYCARTMLAALGWCQLKLSDVDMRILKDLARDRLFEQAPNLSGSPSSTPSTSP